MKGGMATPPPPPPLPHASSTDMCIWSDLATNWLKLDSNTLDNIVCEYPILLMHLDLLRIPHGLFTNKY